jgi:deoxyinosine 3'endonuclease (endonuclease V)
MGWLPPAPPWPTNAEELVAVQDELARATAAPWPTPAAMGRVAACFVCFELGRTGPGVAGDRGWAAACLAGVEGEPPMSIVRGLAETRYGPGLLALRDGPLLEAALRSLPAAPDLLVVNATGRDHPRRAGLALHLGARLGLVKSGVGVAGESASGVGVHAKSISGRDVVAESKYGSAIDANSGEGPAIRAGSDTASAISAVSKKFIAIVGYGGEPDGQGGSNGGLGTTGVMGFSGAGYGVAGMAKSGEGVHASSETGNGVYAYCPTGFGLTAVSDSGVAVRAVCHGGTAVEADAEGDDPEIAGVNARHEQGDAVRGWSKATGIRGITVGSFDFETNRDVVGVLGISQSEGGYGGDGIGVEGRSDTGIGVLGAGQQGVHGASGSPGGTGVLAKSETGAALHAIAVYPDQGARAIVAEGPVEFSSAGRGIIARGATRATVVSPVALDATVSKILVTLLADPAGKKASSLSHVEIDGSEAFTVVLTAPAAREVPFAYFVLG